MFDENSQPKPAFYRILDFDKQLPRWQEDDKLPKLKEINYSIDDSTDTLTVKGRTDGSKSVSATIYNPDGISINSERTVTANGDYEVKLKINAASLSEGTLPEYRLAVKEGNADEVSEDFTYYSKQQFENSYTLHDSLNDNSKMYSYFNIKMDSNLTFYEDDWSGVGLESKQHSESCFVYKLPESKKASSVTVDAYVYENTLWDPELTAKPIILGSADGKTYSRLSDDDLSWKQIKKEKHTDNGMANQRRHFEGTVKNITDNMKYIKIDLSEFKTNWHVYIADVSIGTKNVENYMPPEKTDVSVNDTSLFFRTDKGDCLTTICHSGEFSGRAEVENDSGTKRDIMFLTAYKEGEKLTKIGCSREVLNGNEKKEFKNTITIPSGSDGVIEQYVFDMGSLSPLIEKKTYGRLVDQDIMRDSSPHEIRLGGIE